MEMFPEQECKAFDLGRRMAEAGFAAHDNPFTTVHPRFAVQWSRGFLALNRLRNIAGAQSPRTGAVRKDARYAAGDAHR